MHMCASCCASPTIRWDTCKMCMWPIELHRQSCDSILHRAMGFFSVPCYHSTATQKPCYTSKRAQKQQEYTDLQGLCNLCVTTCIWDLAGGRKPPTRVGHACGVVSALCCVQTQARRHTNRAHAPITIRNLIFGGSLSSSAGSPT